jgi:two-component system sensor histidine kinase EvgS
MDFVMPATVTVPSLPLFRATGADVLVADDDPASRRFLADGMSRLDARVVTCADGIEALALARGQAFDLLLLDCRMPGAGALQILSALRQDEQASSRRSIAVASSAEMAPTERSALLAAGFSDVLVKPCKLSDLQRLLGWLPNHPTPPLDDQAGLQASGDPVTMTALRGLLRAELELLKGELARMDADHTALAERLHRLRSSCGFCGATMLSTATVALQEALGHASADIAPCLQRFNRALDATLQALDA